MLLFIFILIYIYIFINILHKNLLHLFFFQLLKIKGIKSHHKQNVSLLYVIRHFKPKLSLNKIKKKKNITTVIRKNIPEIQKNNFCKNDVTQRLFKILIKFYNIILH